jgi:hypothetical protein
MDTGGKSKTVATVLAMTTASGTAETAMITGAPKQLGQTCRSRTYLGW